MTMEFCRFRDFAVPLLGLSTHNPSIHQMRATRLVDSSFRAPHLPRRRRNAFLLRADDFTIYSGQIRAAAAKISSSIGPSLGNQQDTSAEKV
jgi:hypothetical protein